MSLGSPRGGFALFSFICCLFVGISLVGATFAPSIPQTRPAPPLPPPAGTMPDVDIERFLLEARIVKTRSAGKGITGSIRATLTDGTITHDAQIQTIDEAKREFRSMEGVEFNFRDSWTFNVAAYRIDRMLDLRFVPVSIERRWRSTSGAFTWWVDDVQMDEGDRLKKGLTSPDPRGWNEEMQLVRLFDQLIYNIDRNVGNLLITTDWSIWAIDHTRAFRTHDTLKMPANVARCDRKIFERLKRLNSADLRRQLSPYLNSFEINTMLKRRDAIVALIEKRGEAGLFDRKRMQ
jgi:hypothetical protein